MGTTPQATEQNRITHDRVTSTANAALLARAAATWPDLGRYLEDMRLGVGLAFDSDRGVMVPRMTIVVEVKGEQP